MPLAVIAEIVDQPPDEAIAGVRAHMAAGARAVLSGTSRAHEAQLGPILGELLAAMRTAGPGLPSVEGCPYITYFADVSQDSDGPVEIVRPMAELAATERAAHQLVDVQARVEPGHDEAYVRLTMSQTRDSATMPALAALEAFVTATGRVVGSPPRQVMIADWRTARPGDPACDLAVVVHG